MLAGPQPVRLDHRGFCRRYCGYHEQSWRARRADRRRGRRSDRRSDFRRVRRGPPARKLHNGRPHLAHDRSDRGFRQHHPGCRRTTYAPSMIDTDNGAYVNSLSLYLTTRVGPCRSPTHSASEQIRSRRAPRSGELHRAVGRATTEWCDGPVRYGEDRKRS